MNPVLELYDDVLAREDADPLVLVAFAGDGRLRLMINPAIRNLFRNDARHGLLLRRYILNCVGNGLEKVMTAPLDDITFEVRE